MTITIKQLAKACEVSDQKMSKTLREIGMDILLNEATRLQAINCWDNKSLAPRNEIDIKFVKDAYDAIHKNEL